MNEEKEHNEIPVSLAPEGHQLFEDLFGIPFNQAQELARIEGEIGQKWRDLFLYLKGDAKEGK